MPRPASAPANAFINQGVTTLRWGTDGFLQDAALQSAIVRNIRQHWLVDVIKEENNAGYIVNLVEIIQGQHYEITVTDDVAKAWPTPGSKLLIFGADDQSAPEFIVLDPSYNAARKQTGERILVAEAYTAFSIV